MSVPDNQVDKAEYYMVALLLSVCPMTNINATQGHPKEASAPWTHILRNEGVAHPNE